MSKHLADKRESPSGGRIKAFMRLARAPREGWRVAKEDAKGDASGLTRLRHFLRIDRGHRS